MKQRAGLSSVELIAANLRRLRTRSGMSQYRLADSSGISRSTIAAIERCRYEGAHSSTMDALAEALGVTVDELLHEPEAPKGRRRGVRR